MAEKTYKLKWYYNLYYYGFIYLPVFVLLSLIVVVYISFISTYVAVLIQTPSSLALDKYQFNMTSSPENAFQKGLALLIITSFFFLFLLIALLRTIFMDPGYFPSPIELENQIVDVQSILKDLNYPVKLNNKGNKQIPKNKEIALEDSRYDEKKDMINKYKIKEYSDYTETDRIQFLTEFHDIIGSGPLNAYEQVGLSEKITRFLNSEGKKNLEKDRKSILSYESSYKSKIYKLPGAQENQSNYYTGNPEDVNAFFDHIELSKAMLCGTCLRYKVERSHHCRQCGKCVLKMDHHCPWLANCIGFRNYKYFLLIEFHGILAIIPIISTFWEALVNYNASKTASLAMTFFVTFSFFVAIGLLCFMIWLVVINWKLAFTGQTVIENADRERFPLNKNINIYDVGTYKNFVQVFGENPFLWFFPFNANYKGNGVVFETIYNTVEDK